MENVGHQFIRYKRNVKKTLFISNKFRNVKVSEPVIKIIVASNRPVFLKKNNVKKNEWTSHKNVADYLASKHKTIIRAFCFFSSLFALSQLFLNEHVFSPLSTIYDPNVQCGKKMNAIHKYRSKIH